MNSSGSLTPLALLLTRLHISSLDLANAIHVDPSLISRWKNGNRRFDSSSEHYSSVINYFLNRDEKVNCQNIVVFLQDYMPDWDFSDKQKIFDALDKWLSGLYYTPPASPANTFPAVPDVSDFGIIKGQHKKKEMLLHFLDSAISLPDKKNIYIMLDQETNAMLGYSAFYNSWSERLKAVIAKGHEVYFIYAISGSDAIITALDNFLNFCFAPNVHAYYLPKPTAGISIFDLFIIEGVLALTDFIYSPDRRHPILFSFTHVDMLQKLKEMFLNIFNICSPLLKRSNNRFSHISLLDVSFANDKLNLCILDSTPYMFPVEPDLFEEILDYNGFSPSQKALTMRNYMTIIYNPLIQSAQSDNSSHIIWNQDMLLSNMHKEEILFPQNLLSDCDIRIPQKFYKRYLEQVVNYILLTQQDARIPFNLSLVDNSFEQVPSDMLIYTVNNTYTYIYSYSSEYEQKTLSFTNPALTADTYIYLSNLWCSLVNENKNAKNLLMVLGKLIKRL